METFNSSQHPHRRYNPLIREWVLCSPHRAKRPWQGQTESAAMIERPTYDSRCYLCPGNTRAEGQQNPNYTSTFTFENDYAAVTDTETSPGHDDTLPKSLFRTEIARGKCFVICFNPRHDLTIAELEAKEIVPIVDAWCDLYRKISTEHPFIRYVQIFENKGAVMGCSNPHPHGQAWALSYIPTISSKILDSQRAYADEPNQSNPTHSSMIPRLSDGRPSLLLDYAQAELKPKRSARVIYVSTTFMACVPFWALWPFEIMIIPHQDHIPSLLHMSTDQRTDLAHTIGIVTRLYDNLFHCSFPYSMGLHQSPPQLQITAQFHLSFYPPLLRNESVKKFQVGFEMFAESQRDLTPEQAARMLREALSDTHYKKRVT
ncbi:HIT-like domain-containing protein [Melampsora americana]|nr:HIT-like domain-containing protein [Melampsora americana]